MDLWISRIQRQQLLDWAKAAEPEECCGLLLGRNGVVERVERTANVAAQPLAEFEIDPASLITAEKHAREGGLAILGYFHSHPNGKAEPSVTDAQMAAADGRCWFIIAGGQIASWRPFVAGSGDAVRFVSQGFV